MATRTVQLIGQGYGSSPATITVTANSTQVFSGPVSTVDQPLPALPDMSYRPTNVLCSFDTDTDFVGSIPMTCEVTSGTVVFTIILANYTPIANPVYTHDQFVIVKDPAVAMSVKVPIYEEVAEPALSSAAVDTLLNPASTPEQIGAILSNHNLLPGVSSGASGYYRIDSFDPRDNVVINGVAQTPDRGDLTGTWFWTINTGSTLGYNLDVQPALV